MRHLTPAILTEARHAAQNHARARKRLGARWFSLALAWSRALPETRAARQDAIKALRPRAKRVPGLGSLAALEETLRDLAASMRQARKLRPGRPYRGGRIRAAADRIHARVHRIVSRADDLCLRQPARYDDFSVQIGPEIGLWVDYSLCRPYKGAYKSYSAKEYSRRITVAPGYLHNVVRPGLTACGGLLTLDAAEQPAPAPGIRLFAAAWLVPGRGYEADVRQGYIALAGGEDFHAATAAAAVAGVRRKLAAAEAARRARRQDADPTLTDEALDAALAVAGTRHVTLRQALALGFCKPGIQGWCALAGIDPTQGASGRQVIAGYRAHPRREVARFIRAYLTA